MHQKVDLKSISFFVCFVLFLRLKIIIFPPIPDPGKIFKEMFGDQNDDTLVSTASWGIEVGYEILRTDGNIHVT
jgi:hypothetical protein